MSVGELKTLSSLVQSVLTSLAILGGGLWFLWQRQRFPRAEVSHSVSHWRIGRSQRVLHVAVTIVNKGNVLVQPTRGQVWVQQVLPAGKAIRARFRSTQIFKDGALEVEWPLIAERPIEWKKGEFEIEPHETDRFAVDLIVPIHVRKVRIYSYLQNVAKRGRPIGWKVVTIVDL